MIRRPPRSTLFPTRRSSDLGDALLAAALAVVITAEVLAWADHDGGLVVGAGLLLTIPLVLRRRRDRKSTRLNSRHANLSYAVFCLKTKKSSDRNNTNADFM